ncbi:MAG: glycine betaine ABC transporter substrate-binding protein [Nitrososphaerales archaeon]
MKPSQMKVALGIGVTLILGVLILFAFMQQSPENEKITVSSKEFTEQLILGNIMKVLLEENGFTVDDNLGLSGTMLNHMALVNGEIDVYMEYSGTAYVVILNKEDIIRDPDEIYNIVKQEYKEKWNLIWLNRAEFDNTYTLMMKEEKADKLEIITISDLAAYVNEYPEELRFATNAEFFARPDGFTTLEEYYDFNFPQENVKKMGTGITYLALEESEVDVAMGFATDGRIQKFGFVILEDNKQFFPIYNPAPVISEDVIEKYPELLELLNQIGPRLSTTEMIEMNYKVDVLGKKTENVAREWLEEEGLVK